MADPMIDPTTDTTTGGVPDAAPVIPAQPTPPATIAAPNMGNASVPTGPTPATPYVIPQGNVPLSQMLLQASAVHHGRIARALNAVGSILGGDTTYHITTNADGSVDAVPQQSTPGEKWGRVAKAALMGAAKGFEVGQGPGGAQRAAAAGIQTGMAMPQAQQDQTMALADKMNNQNQQRLMFNANMALLDQRIITAKNENQRSGVTFAQQVQDHTLNFAKTIRDMGGEMIGHFKTNDEMATQLQQNKLLQAHLGTNGMAIPLTTYDAKGVPEGIDAWVIPEDKRNQLNPTDITIPLMKPDPNNPGKLIEDTPYVIGANTMPLGQIAGAIKSIHDNNNTMTTTAWTALNAAKETEQKGKLLPSQIAQNYAAAAASTAEAGLRDVQTTLAPQTAEVKAGQALGKTMQYHDKNYVQPAIQGEQSYNLANNAYNEYLAAKARGEKLPTGAQSMLMLSQHIANTFGGIKGGPRVTAAMIAQHLGARSVPDSMEAAINHIINGEELSSNQWDAFHHLISEARFQKWRTAAIEGGRFGVAQNYLPADLAQPLAQFAQPAAAAAAPTVPPGAAVAPGATVTPPATTGGFNWGAQPKAP